MCSRRLFASFHCPWMRPESDGREQGFSSECEVVASQSLCSARSTESHTSVLSKGSKTSKERCLDDKLGTNTATLPSVASASVYASGNNGSNASKERCLHDDKLGTNTAALLSAASASVYAGGNNGEDDAGRTGGVGTGIGSESIGSESIARSRSPCGDRGGAYKSSPDCGGQGAYSPPGLPSAYLSTSSAVRDSRALSTFSTLNWPPPPPSESSPLVRMTPLDVETQAQLSILDRKLDQLSGHVLQCLDGVRDLQQHARHPKRNSRLAGVTGSARLVGTLKAPPVAPFTAGGRMVNATVDHSTPTVVDCSTRKEAAVELPGLPESEQEYSKEEASSPQSPRPLASHPPSKARLQRPSTLSSASASPAALGSRSSLPRCTR